MHRALAKNARVFHIEINQRAHLRASFCAVQTFGGALHGDASPEVAAEWNQLALDRLAAVESGRSQLRPGEEVLARMRQLIGR